MAESLTVAGVGAPPERSVVDNTLFSSRDPAMEIDVREVLPYVGEAHMLRPLVLLPAPIAISKDASRSFVFAQHDRGVVERAVVFTFLTAHNRPCLLPDDLRWVESPIETGVFRLPSGDFDYAVAAYEQPFEAPVRDLLQARGLSVAGCYIVQVMTRLFTPDSQLYIFYVENTDVAAGETCATWRTSFDALEPSQRAFVAAFSTHLADVLEVIR